MEALIIQTGTPPGPDGIALWVTMKNSIGKYPARDEIPSLNSL
jgi:hypothetical protein